MKYVILLDDDPDEHILLRDAFHELNVPVDLKWFNDFTDLCDYLESGAMIPDMLFLDINMPQKTGLECLRELKAKPRFSQIPVIIYTNTDYRKNIDDCFALGATVYLRKTTSFTNLQSSVLKILAWNLFNTLSLPPEDRTILN